MLYRFYLRISILLFLYCTCRYDLCYSWYYVLEIQIAKSFFSLVWGPNIYFHVHKSYHWFLPWWTQPKISHIPSFRAFFLGNQIDGSPLLCISWLLISMPIFWLSNKYYLFHPILNFSYEKFRSNSITDFLLELCILEF